MEKIGRRNKNSIKFQGNNNKKKKINLQNCLLFIVYNYLLVLGACHKLGPGDRVRSLHELNKSANVNEG